ncbi:hypothetical protein PR048_026867 [Dryococelus australis]|uniref:Pre-mRNA-splicing factor 38 n=1 Tax=Dryococelus australis TaxID=614101 RepID=A0ABQ9GMI9_9NEOP|nr:hypothetical protein PR048_026867 [Dryococelus australis]
MDEYIDELLREERLCDIILPRIQKRHVLEENNELEPKLSALEDDLDEGIESSGDEEDVRALEPPPPPEHHWVPRGREDKVRRRSVERERVRDRERRRSRERVRERKTRRSRSRERRHRSKSPVARRARMEPERERRRERDMERPRRHREF